MKTIIADLDGTLTDMRERIRRLQEEGKDARALFEDMSDSPVNTACRALLSAMQGEGYHIAIVSGRPDTYEPQITAWLARQGVPWDQLCLRHAGDFRPDTAVMKEMLYTRFTRETILFVVEDREDAARMWREEGLLCVRSGGAFQEAGTITRNAKGHIR